VNEILKQRLVGALILLALGVVFWPIIFVEPGDINDQDLRQIPPRPGVDTTAIAAPDKSDLRVSPKLESRAQARRDELARDAAQAARAAAQNPAAAPAAPKAVDTASAGPAAIQSSKSRTEAPEKPKLDAEGVPIAWILQVASVSDSRKADALRGRLLELGYKAYVKKVHRSGKVLLRVYVGPKFERAQLDNIKSSVDAEFSVESMVVRYLP
jgi:DedD protein